MVKNGTATELRVSEDAETCLLGQVGQKGKVPQSPGTVENTGLLLVLPPVIRIVAPPYPAAGGRYGGNVNEKRSGADRPGSGGWKG
jgi:hypothetical protein